MHNCSRKILIKDVLIGVICPVSVEVCSLSRLQYIGAWTPRDAWASNERLWLHPVGKLHKRSVLCDVSNALVLGCKQIGALSGNLSSSVGTWHLNEPWYLLYDRWKSCHWGSIRRCLMLSLTLVCGQIPVKLNTTNFLELKARQLLQIGFWELSCRTV